MTVRIIQGDCREVLDDIGDGSVHCVVTSPPFWQQRDYGEQCECVCHDTEGDEDWP